ncbi:MAG: hypothetical protein DI534_11560 [Leifsonia xyli]|nr:MAG: hypothetical protein DI534_11560 [Leifsonia xyli]
MSRRSSSADHSYLLRDTSSTVIFWVAVGIMALLLADFAFIGEYELLATAVPFMLFLGWAIWVLLLRPRVRYDTERARVISFFRSYQLPWPQVAAVRQRLNLLFELEDGRVIVAYAVTASRGSGAIVRTLTGRLRDDPSVFTRTSDDLEEVRRNARPSDEQVLARWDAVPIVLGIVTTTAAVVTLIVSLSG